MSHHQLVKVKINEQIHTMVANPAVTPKASRRRFRMEYKLKVLAEAEACKKPGELGARGIASNNRARTKRLVGLRRAP